jgi:hypothetical protein
MYRLNVFKNRLLRIVTFFPKEPTVIDMKTVCIRFILILAKFAKHFVEKNTCISQVNTVLSLRVLRH